MSLAEQHQFFKRQAQRKHDDRQRTRRVEVLMARGGVCRTTAIQILNKSYRLEQCRLKDQKRSDEHEQEMFMKYLHTLETLDDWARDKVNQWKFNVHDDDQKSRVHFYNKVIRVYGN